MTLPVLVINRARDAERLARFSASAEALGVTFERVAAHDAHRPSFPFALYKSLIGRDFWGSTEAKPGAIGCFLSHRRAWARVLDAGHPRALICEDDAVLHTTPSTLESTPSDCDIVFANDRMAAWLAASGLSTDATVPDVVNRLVTLGGPKAAGARPSPGADCYMVSAAGARRLLDLTEEQGIRCGVDWAMVRATLADVTGAVDAFPELAILGGLSPGTPLSSRVSAVAVAGQGHEGPSTIRHSLTRPVAELTAMSSENTGIDNITTLHLSNAELRFAGLDGPDPVMASHRDGDLWDEAGLTLLLERFPEGGTFVDVGAHVGNHAVAVGRLGAAGRVVLVEPNEDVHAILRLNLSLNGLSAIAELPEPSAALWSHAGSGRLSAHGRRSSESRVRGEQTEDGHAVRLMTGDDLLVDAPVHAIKIDTMGSEPEVLRGFSRTLETWGPDVLLDHGHAAQERISRLADERGYRIAASRPSSRRNRVSSLLVPRPGGAR